MLWAAFALRLFRLGGQSIWWDEGISLHLATSSVRQILADRVVNIHPPLYFLLLKGWVSLVGFTPFAGRYFSLLAGVVQVALVYAVCRRWLGQKVAWLAGGLMTVTAVTTVYSQETRVYAFLPLITLSLLLLSHEITQPRPLTNRKLAVLGLLVWVSLHLHYIVVFLLLYVGVWTLLALLWQKRWADLRRWLTVQVLAGLASLPWAIAVLAHWGSVTGEANAGTLTTEATPLRFLLGQVWIFHLTGLPGLLGDPWVGLLAGLVAVAGGLLLAFNRGRSAQMLVHWLVPVAATFLVWSVRSFSHPRYVVIFTIGLVPLVAVLVVDGWRNWWGKWVGGVLLAAFVAVSLVGDGRYLFDPAMAKSDMRGVAHYLAQNASANDLIFIPDTDWSLPFEYHGPAPITMPGTEHPETVWAHLAQATAVPRHVFVVDYRRGTRDWQGVLPFALEKAGHLVRQTAFEDLTLWEYALNESAQAPVFAPLAGQFGPLQVQGVWLDEAAASNTAVALALQWRLSATTPARFHVALRLQDSAGAVIARQDQLLLNASGSPTEGWTDDVTTYHLVPLPLGTPPLAYRLFLSVYTVDAAGMVQTQELLSPSGAPQGQQLALGEVTLAVPTAVSNAYSPEAPLPLLPEPTAVAPGLDLAAFQVDSSEGEPGQAVTAQLLWHKTASADLASAPVILWQNGVSVAQTEGEVWAVYPPAAWQVGEWVWEQRRLVLPAGLAAGDAELRLGDSGVLLGELAIQTSDHSFVAPTPAYPLDISFGEVARLVGYDLPQTAVTSAQTVPITLYWQALSDGPAVSYVVFVHLLGGDGRVIAQHDGLPVQGARLTTGWVRGEYLTDFHESVFREPAYQGSAQIEVGLYDPLSNGRLLTNEGKDAVYLPTAVTITVP